MARRLRIGLITIILAAAIALLGGFRVLEPLAGGITFLLRPLNGRVFSTSSWLGSFLRERDDRHALDQANLLLQQTANALRQENADLQLQLEGASLLESERAFLVDRNLDALPARVIGRSSDAVEQTLIVNQGERDGVATGLAVISTDGQLIGTIASTTPFTSLVLLLQDEASDVGAEVLNDTGATGVVRGDRGLSMTMSLIEQTQVITDGQTVITSGIESTIPRGLVIGLISSVSAVEGDLFQTATIASTIDPVRQSIVSIVRPGEGGDL